MFQQKRSKIHVESTDFPATPRPGCCTTTAPPPLPAPAEPGASPVPQRAAPRRCWRGSRRRHPRCVGVAFGRFRGGLGGVSWSSEVAIGFEMFWTQLGTSIKLIIEIYWTYLAQGIYIHIIFGYIWAILGVNANRKIKASATARYPSCSSSPELWPFHTKNGHSRPARDRVMDMCGSCNVGGFKWVWRVSLGWSCCDSQIWSDSPSLGDSEHRKSSPTLMDGPWPVLHKNVPWRNGWWRDASGTAGPAETLGWRSHCDYKTPPNVQREICPCRPVPPPVGQT